MFVAFYYSTQKDRFTNKKWTINRIKKGLQIAALFYS